MQANYTDFVLIGDFNFNKITWDNTKDQLLPRQPQLFMDLVNQFGLTQLNTNPSTKHGNILDLVLTNLPEKFSKIFASTYSYRTDHYLLDFNIDMIVDKIKPPTRTI